MKVAFYKDRTQFLDSLIAWWTRGPYSHIELVFERDGKNLCASASPRDGGIRLKEIELDPNHWDIIEIEGYDEEKAFGGSPAEQAQNMTSLACLGLF